ncbi:MAG: hypothetical protein QOJ38_512 [Solirubrobacterales bacterium]|jgi:hypothetical protein|nr:hypothetical protein [Solirubrobacterales bacterium]
MITRKQILILVAVSWTSSIAMGIAVWLWDWRGELVFIVPFVSTWPLGLIWEWRGSRKLEASEAHGPGRTVPSS